jgi:CAAX prenyl protease-like protein
MTANPSRVIPLLEALAFTAYVAWYIWQLQAAVWYSWIVLLVWLVASFALHKDTARSLGWRADNLGTATKRASAVFFPCALAIVVAGFFLGGEHHTIWHVLLPRRFFGYMAFCLMQQVGLNSLVTNRLVTVIENPVRVSLIAGTLFALLHWPNPVLVPLTFIGGALMVWLFVKERNILPLTLWQAVLGSLVWWAFPIAWHHSMRVGPGFYHFHAH